MAVARARLVCTLSKWKGLFFVAAPSLDKTLYYSRSVSSRPAKVLFHPSSFAYDFFYPNLDDLAVREFGKLEVGLEALFKSRAGQEPYHFAFERFTPVFVGDALEISADVVFGSLHNFSHAGFSL